MFRRVWPAVAVLAFLTLTSAHVYAQGAPPSLQPAPQTTRWYGWQILVADAAVFAATGLCVKLGYEDPCWVPAAGYLLTGPIVHGVHRSPLRAAGSVGLRVVLPFVGGWIGEKEAEDECAVNSEDGNCAIGEALTGFALGMLAAVALDAIWALDDAKVETPASPATARRGGLSLTPTISTIRGGGRLGLAGRF